MSQMWVCVPQNQSLKPYVYGPSSCTWACPLWCGWAVLPWKQPLTPEPAWFPGWLQQHHGESDRFNFVTALLNDLAGAEIKWKWLKPAAVLAGWKMFQMSWSLCNFQKYICISSPTVFWKKLQGSSKRHRWPAAPAHPSPKGKSSLST